jgi:hypothetical protein
MRRGQQRLSSGGVHQQQPARCRTRPGVSIRRHRPYYSGASSSDDVLKHLLALVHDLAETPNTEARQHLFSTVEIPPAVQSASTRHNRVVE